MDCFRISGFGHLVGPIMGVFALIGGDFAILYVDTFPAYPNIGRVITTSEGGVSNKTSDFKRI